MKTVKELAVLYAHKKQPFYPSSELAVDLNERAIERNISTYTEIAKEVLESLLQELPEPQTQPRRHDYGYSEGEMEGHNSMLKWIQSIIQDKLK